MDQHYIVDQQLLSHLIRYLAQQPYKEVHGLILRLQTLKQYEEEEK